LIPDNTLISHVTPENNEQNIRGDNGPVTQWRVVSVNDPVALVRNDAILVGLARTIYNL